MPDAGARHNPSSVTLKVLCNKEENLSYCCPVITIDWQCNMHWMHEIFTGQWNQVCCHERHLEVFSNASLPGWSYWWVWHSSKHKSIIEGTWIDLSFILFLQHFLPQKFPFPTACLQTFQSYLCSHNAQCAQFLVACLQKKPQSWQWASINSF